MFVVHEGSLKAVVQSSVVQMSDALSVLLVWFAVACEIFLVSTVCTKFFLLHEDFCIVLIFCTCDTCTI